MENLQDKHEKYLTKARVVKILTYTALAFWAAVVLFPFYWMILTSIKSYGSYNAESTPKFVPTDPTFENYATAFTSVPLLDDRIHIFLTTRIPV